MVLGEDEEHKNKYKIRWSPEGFRFTTALLINIGTKKFDCEHGNDRKVIA